uniref:Uncharacterized protein n=1 Tax=Phlebotomus papatasi TaxID=29031 RepID=A0A1B0DM01_PHLPP
MCGYSFFRNILGNKLLHFINFDTSDSNLITEGVMEKREQAWRKMKEDHKKFVEKFNEGRKSPHKYQVGDLVLAKTEHPASGESRKLLPRFRGPYQVKRVLGADRYEIGDTESTQVTQIPYLARQDHELVKVIDVLSGVIEQHPLEKHWKREYMVSDGRLYKKDAVRRPKFVVPKGVRYQVIRGAHDDVGHPKLERCLEILKKNF